LYFFKWEPAGIIVYVLSNTAVRRWATTAARYKNIDTAGGVEKEGLSYVVSVRGTTELQDPHRGILNFRTQGLETI
jgi:hypothetical protein